MAREANTARPQKAQVTTHQVDQAWKAYNALQLAAREQTALLENPYFTALQDTAYARFLMTFEVSE